MCVVETTFPWVRTWTLSTDCVTVSLAHSFGRRLVQQVIAWRVVLSAARPQLVAQFSTWLVVVSGSIAEVALSLGLEQNAWTDGQGCWVRHPVDTSTLEHHSTTQHDTAQQVSVLYDSLGLRQLLYESATCVSIPSTASNEQRMTIFQITVCFSGLLVSRRRQNTGQPIRSQHGLWQYTSAHSCAFSSSRQNWSARELRMRNKYNVATATLCFVAIDSFFFWQNYHAGTSSVNYQRAHTRREQKYGIYSAGEISRVKINMVPVRCLQQHCLVSQLYLSQSGL